MLFRALFTYRILNNGVFSFQTTSREKKLIETIVLPFLKKKRWKGKPLLEHNFGNLKIVCDKMKNDSKNQIINFKKINKKGRIIKIIETTNFCKLACTF